MNKKTALMKTRFNCGRTAGTAGEEADVSDGMAEPATGAAGDSAGKKGPEEARPAPKCQFPGCQADLSLLKRYNMRCKICDEHRLAESLTVQGVESRFCQQCNRFHQVDAFEKGKRGCKEKLEKHNKRYARRRARAVAFSPTARHIVNQ